MKLHLDFSHTRVRGRPGVLWSTMPFRVRSALVLLCLWTWAVRTDGQTVREYQVKGAFLVNFARFIEWPDDVFDGPTGPFDMCIVGERWMYDELVTTIKGKEIAKRRVHLRALGETTDCHLLFVGGSQPPERIFQQLADFTLRVGEQHRFVAAGGHISFHLHGDRVHFEIAPDVAQHQRFRVSSRLIVLADKENN